MKFVKTQYQKKSKKTYVNTTTTCLQANPNDIMNRYNYASIKQRTIFKFQCRSTIKQRRVLTLQIEL